MSDRVVVIGDPNSVFVQAPVRYWRDCGVDAVILTSRWKGPSTVAGDLPVITAELLAPAWLQSATQGLYPLLDAMSTTLLAQDEDRIRVALSAWAHTASAPSLAPPVFDAILIAAAADVLSPACVFGHEAFAHGLATSLCRAPRRALFAWGADVLQYARMTDIAFAMVRQALHGVHYVLTNTMSIEDLLHNSFGVPRQRIAHISYGVDRRLFQRATPERAARIRSRLGVRPGARTVMNIRRFLPNWGNATAWPAMVTSAERHPDIHLILLGGVGTETELARALDEAQARGLRDRLTVLHGDAPMETVAELMSVADVSLSLAGTLEPVSWSVLQAAASGSAVIVADQASYACECDRGLAALRVTPASVEETTTAISALLHSPARRAAMAAASDRYVTTHHDRDAQFTRLLRIVAGAETADRLRAEGLRRPVAPCA